jgi:hypothetical protein
MRRRAATIGWMLALAAPFAAAQDSFAARAQAADGRWSAAEHGGSADADLAVTSLMLLALLGDGSTMRAGPFREQVTGGLRWLLAGLDAQGRLRLRPDPGWLLDHAMGTYALAEAVRLSPLRGVVCTATSAAARALATELARMRPPPGIELRLWAELVARSLSAAADAAGDAAAHGAALREVAALLRATTTGLRAVAPAGPRERAAALLLAELRGERPIDAAALPADLLADPLESCYVLAGRWRRGGEAWREAQPRIELEVVKTQVHRSTDGHAGTWSSPGAFGERHGRLGTTAAAILLLEFHYRYCRLELANGA